MHGYWGKLRSQQENAALRDWGGRCSVEKLRCQKSDPCNSVPESVFLEREGMQGGVNSPFSWLIGATAPCE